MTVERVSWYGGIVDTKGVESCLFLYNREEAVADVLASGEDKESRAGVALLRVLELRARFNSARHPIVYTALMSDKEFKQVGGALRADPRKAIDVLNSKAQEIRVHGGAKAKDWARLARIVEAMKEGFDEHD